MEHFLVERYLPSTARADVQSAVERLARRDAGAANHLWTALIEAEETCISLFEANSKADVEAANRAAEFPFDRVVPASVFGGADR